MRPTTLADRIVAGILTAVCSLPLVAVAAGFVASFSF